MRNVPIRAADVAVAKTRREEPRIPFGALVERGLIKPGEVMFDPRRRWTARVRADGTVISAEAKGSIHAVGAAVQGAPACNGWMFWHVERDGAAVPIDVLRARAGGAGGGLKNPSRTFGFPNATHAEGATPLLCGSTSIAFLSNKANPDP